jgi:NAD(P)-dependent dehydrogenase (short-subunit alcohol dehydrogenase family)
MSERKVWFITGAGRGMGVDIAKAALDAGNAVVATGRNTDAVAEAVGEADNLLVVKLDVTSRADAEAAVQAAVQRFGRIDVLVTTPGTSMRATSRS